MKIYYKVGFPFVYLKNYYGKLLVVSKDEIKNLRKFVQCESKKYYTKYEEEAIKKDVEKLNKVLKGISRENMREFDLTDKTAEKN